MAESGFSLWSDYPVIYTPFSTYWLFSLSPNLRYAGDMTNFSISEVSVPESGTFILLFIGLFGLLIHRKLTNS